MYNDYTVVLGVDEAHLRHFYTVLPNWMKYRPWLFDQRFLIFSDSNEVLSQCAYFLDDDDFDPFDRKIEVDYVHWDPEVAYVSDGTKWTNPQRQKMLAGFVHIPPEYVDTAYWLKLDLDVVFSSTEEWDPSWFKRRPAIVAQRWKYTKPPFQMMELDSWVAENHLKLPQDLTFRSPLNLVPNPGSSLVRHNRVISWCGFFETEFSSYCSHIAQMVCGEGKLPVPSQDGFMWYVAERLGRLIVRQNFKSRGFIHRSTLKNVKSTITEKQL